AGRGRGRGGARGRHAAVGVRAAGRPCGGRGTDPDDLARFVPGGARAVNADPILFRDLAYVFVAAVLGGSLAWLARQPLILGYVLGRPPLSPPPPAPPPSATPTLQPFPPLRVAPLMLPPRLPPSLTP